MADKSKKSPMTAEQLEAYKEARDERRKVGQAELKKLGLPPVEQLEKLVTGSGLVAKGTKFSNSGKPGWNATGRIVVNGHECQLGCNITVIE